jgi:hypothetical protein
MTTLLPLRREPRPEPSPRERRARSLVRQCLADNQRLDFLRALEAAIDLHLADPDWGFVHGTLQAARHQRYHYIMTESERRHCDTLRQACGEILATD